MRHRAALVILAVAVLSPDRARAGDVPVEVDRVLAVVDDQVVTWQEIRARVVPFEKQIAATDPDRAKKQKALVRDMVAKRIDELLIEKAARRNEITVTDDEVDLAVSLVAKNTKITPAELAESVKKQGLSMAEYRAEIRRQILEGKYVRLATATDVGNHPLPNGGDLAAWWMKRRDEVVAKLRSEAFVEQRP